jgi:hypothetical protein
VGIDRADEDDPPTVARDSSAPRSDSPAAEPDLPAVGDHDCGTDADRVAYNLEYRADVEAEYAWSEAAPLLREAWAEHERKYPRPERSVPTLQPDGSWHGDDNRKLSPEQNAEVDRHCDRVREVGERTIIPAMRAIEAEDPDRRLIGFDKRFKEPDRLKDKVADELRPSSKLTVAEAIESVPDSARFTLCYRPSSYSNGVREDVERLKGQGFELIRLKNTWTRDQYKGINSQWREQGSGVVFEVQFHTQVSADAKELTHKAYERLRNPGTLWKGERRELRAFQREVCAKILIPRGAADIDDYPPEKLDG